MRYKTVIEILTKEDCCLCDEAKDVLKGAQKLSPFEVKEIDITKDAELFERYKEEIPVIFINGRKAFKYRIDTKELLKRLRKIKKQ